MSAAPALDAPARHRLLGLMGVTQYVLRAPRGASAAKAGDAMSRTDASGTDTPVAGTGVLLLCDAREAGNDPSQGRYAGLLKQLCAAFGARGARAVTAAPDGCAIAFGAAPPDAANVLLAPPLATVRESARAKRAVWRQLRGLVRRGN